MTVAPPATVTSCPSAAASTSSSVLAIPSTAPSGDRLARRCRTRASATVETAQSTGRPRASAMAVMLAIASLRTLSPIVPVMSSPPLPTGDAAPMFVPGAM